MLSYGATYVLCYHQALNTLTAIPYHTYHYSYGTGCSKLLNMYREDRETSREKDAIAAASKADREYRYMNT